MSLTAGQYGALWALIVAWFVVGIVGRRWVIAAVSCVFFIGTFVAFGDQRLASRLAEEWEVAFVVGSFLGVPASALGTLLGKLVIGSRARRGVRSSPPSI